MANDKKNTWDEEFNNRFEKKVVLITGSNGFIGSHLSDALISLGAVVFGIGLPIENHKVLPYKYIGVNLAGDKTEISELVMNIRPNYVFHLAGLVNTNQDLGLVFPTLENNLIASVNLLMSLTNVPCERVVITSSSEAPINFQSPNSPYAASKLALIEYARMFNDFYELPTSIARPFMGFGPKQLKNKLIPLIILSLLKGEVPKLSSGKRICDFIYVNDIIRGLLLMALNEKASGSVIDLGMGIGISIEDIVKKIIGLMKSPLLPEFGSIADRVGEMPQIARRKDTFEKIGWNPIWTLEEGLINTISWYKNNY
jgi:nucleoside-diphosphate-sugar epimerase